MRFMLGLLLILVTTLSYADISNNQYNNDKQLVFFFESTCPYCQKIAPIVAKLAKKYKVQVIGDSIDGKPIADFPNALSDDKLAEEFKIEKLPTIGGLEQRTHKITVLTVGLHDEESLESAIGKWLSQ